jgi:hypothetical protein
MNLGNDILKSLKRVYERRLEPEYLRILAEGYWRSLLVIALIAILCLILFGFWQFIAVVDDLAGAQSGSGTKPPVALNRAMLQSTLAAFDQRHSLYSSGGGNASFKDPSK